MSLQSDQGITNPGYPEGDTLQRHITRRHTWGLVWRLIFQISTIVGIIALAALLYNIINGSFGYVAMQNKIDPDALVLTVNEEMLLEAANTTSSEDDKELVEGITDNPEAIGFFGYAYYQQNSDKLNVLSIEGIPPSAEPAATGEYPLARPLFIYTSAEIMQEKPQVAQFVNFYLSNLNKVVEEVGYFPVTEEILIQEKQSWLAANNLPAEAGELPPTDPAGFSKESSISIGGSSTVYPISRAVAIAFRRAGYPGALNLDLEGTSAGLARFCAGEIDITNASRPINRAELEACQKTGREPLEIRVGTDALVVVEGEVDSFLDNLTMAELRQIFTTAETWSEVNPAWPNTPIERFIPGADSGTLDFFAETVFTGELEDLPHETLVNILETNISPGLLRRFESETPLAERSQEEVYELVVERVVQPTVRRSWKLVESLLNRAEIEAEVEKIPNGSLEFRSWLSNDFIRDPQSSNPQDAGVRTALLGSLWIIAITIGFAFPLGLGAAIYLEEYAAHVANPLLRRFNEIIQTNINNLAGVPSIIYGMLGLAIFVRGLELITSGTLFGLADPTTANGRTILSAGLTMGLLILPLLIINSQEAIRAVPNSLRQASMGLGATKWQTIWAHVLPNALPGILTGTILSVSRAIGETAPLIVIGASTFIVTDPTNPFSKFTALPIQIYQWTARPQDEYRNIAAAASIVLLVLLLLLNASAILLRNHFSKRRLA